MLLFFLILETKGFFPSGHYQIIVTLFPRILGDATKKGVYEGKIYLSESKTIPLISKGKAIPFQA